ncbi:MBL fold metallo-hydrolase [Aggregatilineales bacterium SYSU G02658]
MGNISEQHKWQRPLSNSSNLKLVEGHLSTTLADGLMSTYDPYELAAYVADFDWLAKLSPRVLRSSHHGEFIARANHATLLLQFADTDVLIDPSEGTFIENVKPSVIGVTHAHQDHIGGLVEAASLYRDALILMTPETFELLQLLPSNAASQIAQIMHQRGQLMYADGSLSRVSGVEYRFLPAGHLAGAAMIDIAQSDVRVLITGDFALRELGGLPGAVWTSDPYDVVIMESTHAWDVQHPTADPITNRKSLISACNQAVNDGASRLIVIASALGEAQEAYITICTAQMRGEFSSYTVRFAGKASNVAKLYAKLSSESFSPWKNAVQVIAQVDYIPEKSITIVGGYENEKSAGQKLIDTALLSSDTAIIRPVIGYNRSSVGYTYSISLHASFGELFATASALNCRQVALYHGQGTQQKVSPLVKLLAQIGRNAVHLSNTPKSLGGKL